MPYDLNIEVDEHLVDRVDVPALARAIERVLTDDGVEDGSALAVVLSDDALLRELNLRHREVDAPTDVLSFPADEGEAIPVAEGQAEAGPRYLGDIVVSVERVEQQAAEAGLAAAEELAHVIVHGTLHLLGYDHETPEEEAAMKAREEAILGPTIHANREGHAD